MGKARAKKERAARRRTRHLTFEGMEGRRLLAVIAYDSSQTVLHSQVLDSFVAGSDDMGAPLTFIELSQPSDGTLLTFYPDGSFTYQPNRGFVGVDGFQFEVSNGTETASASVTIEVKNEPPVASASSEQVHRRETLYGFVEGYDDDGDPLTFELQLNSGPFHGSLAFCADGTYVYQPYEYTNIGPGGGSEPDSFVFTVSDGAASASATVTIDVYNNQPQAYESSETVHWRDTLDAFVDGWDEDSADLQFITFVVESQPAHGTVAMDSWGTYSYQPFGSLDADGNLEEDSFVFRMSDGVAWHTATVTIDVTNTPPVAEDGWARAEPDESVFAMVSGSDADSDPLTFIEETPPTYGSLFLDSDGSFEYVPNTGFVGTDSFQFRVSDGVASDVGVFLVSFLQPATPFVDVALTSTIMGRKTPSGGQKEWPGSLEGDDLEFEVTITLPAGVDALANQVTVNCRTEDGTATTADADYTAKMGTLTFPAGAAGAQLTQTITIETGDDTKVEPDEEMIVRLTGAVNAGIAPFGGAAKGVIRNNDVQLHLKNVTTLKTTPDGKRYAEVTLLAPGILTARQNGLDVRLIGNTSDGTATLANDDYVQKVNEAINVLGENDNISDVEILSNQPGKFLFYKITLGGDTSPKAQVSITSSLSKITIPN